MPHEGKFVSEPQDRAYLLSISSAIPFHVQNPSSAEIVNFDASTNYIIVSGVSWSLLWKKSSGLVPVDL